MKKKLICAVVVMVLSIVAMSANAALVLYTDIGGNSATFDNAAVTMGISLSVDGYEDLAPGLHDYGMHLSRPSYDITTASSSGGISLRSTDSIDNVIAGSISMILYNSTDPMTFTFDEAINAFSITFDDIDLDFGGTFTVSIDGGPTTTLLGPSSANNLMYFVGAIDVDSPFSSITFDRTNGDGYSFDNVNYGVPEPATVGLLGLGGLVLRRKRRA